MNAHSATTPGSATPGSATPGSATPGSATPGLGGRGSKGLRRARLAVAAGSLAAAGLTISVAALPSPASAGRVATLKLVSHGSLGKILVNSTGMAVYIYTADGANKSACSGTCAAVWPPVTVPKGSKPTGGAGVTGLGTISSGGKVQVTWHKHPLYTYVLDTGPGVVNGNAVKEGNAIWYAATAKNTSAKSSAATKTTPAGSSAGY